MDIDPDVEEALVLHGARGELMEFIAQGEGCGWCRRPVRLSGERYRRDPVTGNRQLVYSSHGRPGGVVLKACGNRRFKPDPSQNDGYRAHPGTGSPSR